MTDAPALTQPSPSPHGARNPDRAGAAADGRVRRPRLYALDGMRLVAALSVLSFHWTAYVGIGNVWQGKTPRQVIPTVNHLASYGWLGVELFFVISGFVICMSCWGKRPGDFFVSRVVRLYPAYWAGIALTSAVVLGLTGYARLGAAEGLDLKRILINLTMLQEPFGVRHVDGVYWTLWAEMRFYLLFAVVVAMGLTYRRVIAFCGIWAVAGALSVPAQIPLLTTLAMPDQAPFFIAGIAMFLMYRYGQNLLLWGIVGFCWLLALSQIVSIKAVYENVLGYHLSWNAIALGMTLAFAAVLAAALGMFNWANWKWLTVAGALTYPLYLIHQEVGWTVIHLSLSNGLGVRAALGVALVSMLAAAWLIHRLVERPVSGVLKKHLDSSMKTLRRLSDENPAKTGS
ncbi:acyltransferase [Kitasatospora sp. YST-16]|uniref:acyltransferase family protein n=1 Tax=Kitasatospora sp. YST-16 TaxID=2998080 RepID=UPI0022850E53|nr:acyltransferase [Kitasatospora sp. YST-16]WAL72268.1 acyltransferase [Kitasatospora sp. YST-16]WNW38314.1 acyltransferase [Streptomyces sp. Li-HN-5-13]